MLTRIEIDGFKTFRNFGLDVPPFLVVVGRNASGKSNLFDAIKFLAEISSGSLAEAVHNMRGDIDELVHTPSVGPKPTTMRFAVEVLLNPTTRDDFGEEREITHSRLRYEVSLETRLVDTQRQPSSRPPARRRRLYVKHERARLIRLNEDSWVKSLGWRAGERRNLAPYSYKSVETLLDTGPNEMGKLAFLVHQDGRAGRPKSLPADDAGATVLSTLTTMEYLHLWALKTEMQSWRQLHLEPEALRTPSKLDDDDHLQPNGANLANVLHRMVEETATEEMTSGILPALTASMARVIPEITEVSVREDPSLRTRTVFLGTSQEHEFSANVASDGTLRTLGLLVALYDPSEGSLICFEEPENGIFPKQLRDLIRQLQRLVWESIERRRENRFSVISQLILSSHSPLMIRAVRRAEIGKHGNGHPIVWFDLTTLGDGVTQSRATRSRIVVTRDQGELLGHPRYRVPESEVTAFEVAGELD